LLGRGLVEPVDDMEQPAWYPDLLDWLAEDLADHEFDLKRTLRLILTSRAYQLPAVDLPEPPGPDYVFRGPGVRRMSAEQFRDALGSLTGVWFDKPAAEFNFEEAKSAGMARALIPPQTRWIWSHPGAASKAGAERVYFRKSFTLDQLPEEAWIVATCDNGFTLHVNGTKVLSGKDFTQPKFADILPQLRSGSNLLAIEAINHRSDNSPPPDGEPPKASDANPAGLMVVARIRSGDRVLDFATDESWTWSRDKQSGWETVTGPTGSGTWESAFALGDTDASPWKLGAALERSLSTALVHGGVRAGLVPADPLMSALGRPPREQLLTVRQSAATTLQALELTNGETLNDLLHQGAEKLISEAGTPGRRLVTEVFERALSREPTARERRLAIQLVGAEASPEGVEDLLWSVAMLPEFQLIQ
jgi:hypothetical protein